MPLPDLLTSENCKSNMALSRTTRTVFQVLIRYMPQSMQLSRIPCK
nr:MAG TPA: hypothetical protein [Caudoviricetes sp.]DAP23903.1 MAG TPA: hypothetical protein [Caudoviricetes sp.]